MTSPEPRDGTRDRAELGQKGRQENSSGATIAALIRARAEDDNVGLLYGDRFWTWRQVVAEAAVRAAWLRATLDPARPPHVGLLLPNVPEFVFQTLGAALVGACVVGVNPARRGAELVRDIEHTECQLVLADAMYADLYPGVTRIEDQPWAGYTGAALPADEPTPSSPLFLLFTSGSTSAPKAAVRSQARFARDAAIGVNRNAVLYCPMPLTHGNALTSTLFPSLAVGAKLVLRDKFSATAWIEDVRKYGVTFTTTVGRALSYVLSTPPSEHDRDHQLRAVLAPEASPRDTSAFAERFGVVVLTGYGSSEGGIALMPSRKPGSLGVAPAGTDIVVLNKTGEVCETAQFDDGGRLINAERAIGELVRRNAAGEFEGYWANPEAEAERLRDGSFFSGDLAYRDADAVFWFAGRVGGWLRVDSENFTAAPIERIVARYHCVTGAAVVGVPDPLAGDQVLAAIELAPGHSFDPAAFAEFLSEQTDLGTKWAPRFVRISPHLPVVGNGKIDKKPLQREAWLCQDDIWWRPPRSEGYRLMTPQDRAELHEEFVTHDRVHAYPQPSSA
jgi:fatty-acyl-CoA synthase